MSSIIFTRQIKASRQAVWNVITDTAAYEQWNPFVPFCKSSFVVGSPIVMRVRLFPSLTITQKETIQQNQPGDLLAYGINIPLLLSSTRQQALAVIDEKTTRYESTFILKGVLAPLVFLLMGKQLKKGFSDMTEGLVARAEQR